MNRARPGDRAMAGAAWIGRAAVIALAVVALWFCLRNALHGLVEREYPALGMAISPPSAVSEAVIALNRATAKDGLADARARELLEDALRRAPLLGEPFIVAALDASARDDLDRARRLFEEARRRDPRSVVPRYWLFDYYLRYGMYGAGVAEAEPLIRFQPAAASATVAVLTALLDVPEARPALVAGLRAGPIWRRDFFEQVAATPRLRRQGAALLDLIAPGGAGLPREYAAVMRGLVRGGDYARAYDLWLRTLPPGSRPAGPGLFDGDFAGRPAIPPFGWRLFGARRGMVQSVEVDDAPRGTGLAIRSGDGAATLAEQVVLAQPGPHRLGFALRSLEEAPAGDAGLRAEVRCVSNGRTLARTVVETPPARLTAQSLDFDLPSGCGAALIRFSVAPGVEPGPLYALLTDVSLRRR